jgi:DNA ligase (NAD+)
MRDKKKEILYLKAKYYYYIVCEPIMLDSAFDKLEAELKQMNSPVVELVDFPTEKEIENLGFKLSFIVPKVDRDEKKYNHPTNMLSIEKIQVNDETEFPENAIRNFLARITNKKGFEASLKYDGNGIETIYHGKNLNQVLTRGDKTKGLDKTNKLKYVVPNTIPVDDDRIYQVRGEFVIDVDVWDKKYNNPEPGKVSNPRNFLSGIISRDELNIDTLNDLVFVAYDLVAIDKDGNIEHIPDTMNKLKEFGFNDKYEPETIMINSYDDFEKMYFDMKQNREDSNYLIDGIVIKYPEELRNKLGETSHHPKSMVAIKFPAIEVETTIIDIEWNMGKNRDLTPIAILEPVELLGSIVRRTTLSNIGNMFKIGAFPGSRVSIRKAGEIIPQITNIIEKSPNHDEYMKQLKIK